MVTAVGKLQARGQLTIPRAIRKMAGVKPGDTVTLTATGPGKVELSVLPRLTLAEMLDRYTVDEPIDQHDLLEGWKETAADEVVG